MLKPFGWIPLTEARPLLWLVLLAKGSCFVEVEPGRDRMIHHLAMARSLPWPLSLIQPTILCADSVRDPLVSRVHDAGKIVEKRQFIPLQVGAAIAYFLRDVKVATLVSLRDGNGQAVVPETRTRAA